MGFTSTGCLYLPHWILGDDMPQSQHGEHAPLYLSVCLSSVLGIEPKGFLDNNRRALPLSHTPSPLLGDSRQRLSY